MCFSRGPSQTVVFLLVLFEDQPKKMYSQKKDLPRRYPEVSTHSLPLVASIFRKIEGSHKRNEQTGRGMDETLTQQQVFFSWMDQLPLGKNRETQSGIGSAQKQSLVAGLVGQNRMHFENGRGAKNGSMPPKDSEGKARPRMPPRRVRRFGDGWISESGWE